MSRDALAKEGGAVWTPRRQARLPIVPRNQNRDLGYCVVQVASVLDLQIEK
jgi:hypothetical protein